MSPPPGFLDTLVRQNLRLLHFAQEAVLLLLLGVASNMVAFGIDPSPGPSPSPNRSPSPRPRPSPSPSPSSSPNPDSRPSPSPDPNQVAFGIDKSIAHLWVARAQAAQQASSLALSYLSWTASALILCGLSAACVHLISPSASGSGVPQITLATLTTLTLSLTTDH